MNRLLRDAAPISGAAWAAVDDEARRALRHFLAARRFVDFSGPRGFDLASIPVGRLGSTGAWLGEGVDVALRESQPVVETSVDLTLRRAGLETIERGGEPDLEPVLEAARRAALAEDRAVFQGIDERGLPGIVPASPHEPIGIGDDYTQYPTLVTRAVEQLRRAGVGGPYGIVLGPRCHAGVLETTERGYPVIEHLKLVLDGPIVPADTVSGAVVLSARGGDYELVSGVDFEIGYRSHDAETVTLFLRETFAFRVLEPAAAVALVHP